MTEKTDCDRLLVALAQAGDHRAFSRLVEKYQRRVLRLVENFIRDRSAAEDVVQEAFIKAYRALPDFRSESAFYTWMYRIAVNMAKSHWTWHAQRDAVFGVADSESWTAASSAEESPDADTPELILMGKQTARAINEAIETLPPELKLALVLREVDGFTYGEIAEVLTCPVGTVRSRIFRARETIARHLRSAV